MSDTLANLLAIDLRGLKSEVDKLQAIEKWALSNLGIDYTTGDRVEIVSVKPSQSQDGWKIYAETLAVGRTGIADDIHFNAYADGWYVVLRMDRSWSTHERGVLGDRPTVRYWNGPRDELPEGMELPGGYPPEGKIKSFAMPVSWVRKASS